MATRLPVQTWPARPVPIPARDAKTGTLAVFTKDSGVDLVDAVAAGCAVPGAWPPAVIGGRRHVDGGTRSDTVTHLAAGCDRILAVTPSPADASPPWSGLAEETEQVRPAEVQVVCADEASIAACGTNPPAPSTPSPAATAGTPLDRPKHPDSRPSGAGRRTQDGSSSDRDLRGAGLSS
ncbi:MAG: patatin-like phospholipase family protein [Acidimicrobiales bacterium]